MADGQQQSLVCCYGNKHNIHSNNSRYRELLGSPDQLFHRQLAPSWKRESFQEYSWIKDFNADVLESLSEPTNPKLSQIITAGPLKQKKIFLSNKCKLCSINPGFIQTRLCKIRGLLRTSKGLSYCFQGLKT